MEVTSTYFKILLWYSSANSEKTSNTKSVTLLKLNKALYKHKTHNLAQIQVKNFLNKKPGTSYSNKAFPHTELVFPKLQTINVATI
jgi:hypothetical protein